MGDTTPDSDEVVYFRRAYFLASPASLFSFTRFSCQRRNQPESGAFMDRYMVGFVTLNEVLGRFLRRVMCVSFELRVVRDLFDHDSADSSGFGIPAHVITDDKCLWHRVDLAFCCFTHSAPANAMVERSESGTILSSNN